MGISENIKKLRKKYGLTQDELAKIAGVSNKAVSTWEKGTKEPRMGAIERIAAHFGIKKSNLIEDGGMDEPDSQHIVVAEEIVRLPIVGQISCGNGTWAIEEVEGYEETPRSWITGGEYFYLRAKGDSMVGARIYDGDLLLIRKQPDVADGEIAAVLIDDEAVLKRVYRQNGLLVLQSENPNYPPIVVEKNNYRNIRIIGKLKKVVIDF